MRFSRQEYWSGLPLEIFLTQKSNPDLLHCRQIPYQLSYEGILVNARDIDMTKHDPCRKEFTFHCKYFKVLKSQNQINLHVSPLIKEKQGERKMLHIYFAGTYRDWFQDTLPPPPTCLNTTIQICSIPFYKTAFPR